MYFCVRECLAVGPGAPGRDMPKLEKLPAGVKKQRAEFAWLVGTAEGAEQTRQVYYIRQQRAITFGAPARVLFVSVQISPPLLIAISPAQLYKHQLREAIHTGLTFWPSASNERTHRRFSSFTQAPATRRRGPWPRTPECWALNAGRYNHIGFTP